MLFLWLISQSANDGYDKYDSAVVCAATEEDARHVHPSPYAKGWDQHFGWYGEYDCADRNPEKHGQRYPFGDGEWTTPDKVTADQIGISAKGVIEGAVICASLNA